MKQVLTICGLLVVLLVAIVGCLVIFDVIKVDSGVSIGLKFGGAIIFLGICTVLGMMVMGGRNKSGED